MCKGHRHKEKSMQGPFPACADVEAQTAWHVREMVQSLHILLHRVPVDGTLGDKTKGQIATYPTL